MVELGINPNHVALDPVLFAPFSLSSTHNIAHCQFSPFESREECLTVLSAMFQSPDRIGILRTNCSLDGRAVKEVEQRSAGSLEPQSLNLLCLFIDFSLDQTRPPRKYAKAPRTVIDGPEGCTEGTLQKCLRGTEAQKSAGMWAGNNVKEIIMGGV